MTSVPDWRGDVRCELVRGRSTLTRLYARDPLRLLSPRSPRCEGSARTVVMSSFGGGLVAGDDVPIRMTLGPGARLALTTQASGKVYKSDGRPCGQSLHATVGDGALLAVLPDPLCCYAGARYRQEQAFDLDAGGGLVWLDWLTAGRTARGERWDFAAFDARADVRIAGRLILCETLRLDGESAAAMRDGRFDCYAVLAAFGPPAAAVADHLRQAADGWPVRPRGDVLAAASPVAGGAVVRLLGTDVNGVRRRLVELLAPLPSVLGGDPWARKW